MNKESNCLLVFCEAGESSASEPVSLEVLGLALELAGVMGLDVTAAATSDIASEVAAHAVGRVFTSKKSFDEGYRPEWYVAFMEEACSLSNPIAVFFAHTPLGQDIAPRLAQKLGTGLVTDASGVSAEGKKLLVTKVRQGGVALATYSCNTTPQIVTVRARLGSIPDRDESTAAEIIEVEVPAEAQPQWELADRILEESVEIKLEDADVVVSGGRGMGGPEGFELLKELARTTGAAVGASRPPCDAGWISSSQQVGITGKIISPDVYIAVGISGKSQHLSGMGDSKKIVAINKDAEAEIFQTSDYGVVGDYKKVLPALIDTIKESKG